MDQQRARMGDKPAQGEQVEQETGIDDQHLLRCADTGRGFGNVPDAHLHELAAQTFVRIQLPEAARRCADDERRRGRGGRYLHLRLADQSTIGCVQSCVLTERVSSMGGAGTLELPYIPASRSHRWFRSAQWRRKMAAKAALDDEVLPCT
jgi:hypothetical protein